VINGLRTGSLNVIGIDSGFTTLWDDIVPLPGSDEAVISRNLAKTGIAYRGSVAGTDPEHRERTAERPFRVGICPYGLLAPHGVGHYR